MIRGVFHILSSAHTTVEHMRFWVRRCWMFNKVYFIKGKNISRTVELTGESCAGGEQFNITLIVKPYMR